MTGRERKVVDLHPRGRNSSPRSGSPEYDQTAYERFIAWFPKQSAALRDQIRDFANQELVRDLDADAAAILEFMNRKRVGKRGYQPVPANLKLIRARLREGATVAECKAVVAVKWRQVEADEFPGRYFRPATLFNAEKFNQYVGELPAQEEGDA